MDPHFPELELKFDLPANCKTGQDVYFSMMLAGGARACEILHLENVWANRELILWKNGQMLEVGFAWPWLKEKLYGSLKEQAKFKVKAMLRKPVIISEPVLWCLDGYSTGGYFHWVTDILPRLWMAKAYLPDVRFAIPDYFFERWPFVKEYFELLGITKFLILENEKKYKLKKLVVPTRAGNPFYLQPVPIFEGVRWLKEAAMERNKIGGKRIYISRSKARYRKVVNEVELNWVLAKYNFELIYFEDYCLAEQINMCKNAEAIMGLHGAGLTNLVFLPAGSKVIEIRPDKIYHMYNCFLTLCPFFQVQYNFVLCDYSQERFHEEKRIDDYSVVMSPERLDEELGFIFNKD